MKKQDWFLVGLSALLLLAGLHPLELTWLSWFSFLPLFLIYLDPHCRRRDLVLSALTVGVIYYGIGLYWLLYFDARIYGLAFLIVFPTFTLYFFLLSLVTSKIKNTLLKILAAPFLWLVIHQIYALSRLGTIAMDVPFYAALPFLQIASINFLILPAFIVGLNVSLAFLINKKGRIGTALVIIFALGLTGIYFWGNNRLREKPMDPRLKHAEPTARHRMSKRPSAAGLTGVGMTTSTSPKFALIQHNFPVSGVWRVEHAIFIRAEYRRLALEAAKGNPDLIIFPLYSFPDDVLRNPEFFEGLAKETHTWILVATYIPQNPGQSITQGFFDAALLYSSEGKLIDHYQAIQAPPFRDIQEFTGKEYKILETPFGKLGILLCYEDALPNLANKAVQRGADFLIALSNPGHFVSTHMPYYHLLQDQLRAIESNRWLIRVSANGYSAIIDPFGQIIQKTTLNKQQIVYGSSIFNKE